MTTVYLLRVWFDSDTKAMRACGLSDAFSNDMLMGVFTSPEMAEYAVRNRYNDVRVDYKPQDELGVHHVCEYVPAGLKPEWRFRFRWNLYAYKSDEIWTMGEHDAVDVSEWERVVMSPVSL